MGLVELLCRKRRVTDGKMSLGDAIKEWNDLPPRLELDRNMYLLANLRRFLTQPTPLTTLASLIPRLYHRSTHHGSNTSVLSS